MSEATMEQLQKELEHRRESLDSTLTAIERRLSLQAIANNPLQYVQDSVLAEYGGSLREAVNRNPIPVALLGIGLVWLLMGGQGTSPNGSETLPRKCPEAGEPFEPGADPVHHGAPPNEAVPERIQEQTQEAPQQLRTRGGRMTEGPPRQAQRSSEDYGRALQEHPLVLGFVGLALAIGIAVLLSDTGAEYRAMAMGHTSARLTNQQLATGEQLMEGVRSSVKSAAGGEAPRQTGSGTD